MIGTIKKLFSRWPGLYKILATVYQHTIAPMRSGHMWYYIRYLLFVSRKESAKLRAYGLESPMPYAYRSWRIGKGKDGAVRRYYMARYRGAKCFVKIGTRDETVRNELDILSGQQGEYFSFSPAYLVGDALFAESTVMLAVTYIEGLSPFKVPDDRETFEDICRQFNSILDQLAANHIVHADVHKGNLMLANNRLYLLDYGISMIKGKPNTVDYVARPGTFYITGNNCRIYDDAYSFVQMLAQLGIEETLKESSNYRRVAERIGRNILEIKC